MSTDTLYTGLKQAGFNHSVAEALAENGYNAEEAKQLSNDEIFRLFLEWNGILGYTEVIRDALDNIRNMEAAD